MLEIIDGSETPESLEMLVLDFKDAVKVLTANEDDQRFMAGIATLDGKPYLVSVDPFKGTLQLRLVRTLGSPGRDVSGREVPISNVRGLLLEDFSCALIDDCNDVILSLVFTTRDHRNQFAANLARLMPAIEDENLNVALSAANFENTPPIGLARQLELTNGAFH